MTTAERRETYITGLRVLADLLEQHDDLPLPYDGSLTSIDWIETAHTAERQREIAQSFARIIPGTIRKEARDGYFDLDGSIAGLKVSLIVLRDAVCTRVVTDTREVTREIPDPEALAAVPTVTVTETQEVVEWVCEPLLADRQVVTA